MKQHIACALALLLCAPTITTPQPLFDENTIATGIIIGVSAVGLAYCMHVIRKKNQYIARLKKQQIDKVVTIKQQEFKIHELTQRLKKKEEVQRHNMLEELATLHGIKHVIDAAEAKLPSPLKRVH